MDDIAAELAKLHILTGADFSRQVERIARRAEFHPLEGETNILTVGGETSDDYHNLISAARKAVEHGYRVFILPNPKGIKSADFIFEYKGIYKMYDLKTIVGRSSVGNRLSESINQCNRIVLNITTTYNTRSLAFELNRYFEANKDAIEVLIMKGRKLVSVNRNLVKAPAFIRIFKKRYER